MKQISIKGILTGWILGIIVFVLTVLILLGFENIINRYDAGITYLEYLDIFLPLFFFTVIIAGLLLSGWVSARVASKKEYLSNLIAGLFIGMCLFLFVYLQTGMGESSLTTRKILGMIFMISLPVVLYLASAYIAKRQRKKKEEFAAISQDKLIETFGNNGDEHNRVWSSKFKV